MSVKRTKTIRTMREVWDKRRVADMQKGPVTVSQKRQAFNEKDLEELARQKEYFREHLKRKKMVMDFFPEYYKYLDEGGFKGLSLNFRVSRTKKI